jgi:hypothetical protein
MAQPAFVSSTNDFHVIGIALVVDQVGKGPRMILRYPTAAVPTTPLGSVSTNSSSSGTSSSRTKTSLYSNSSSNTSSSVSNPNRSSEVGTSKSLKGSLTKGNTTTPTSTAAAPQPRTSEKSSSTKATTTTSTTPEVVKNNLFHRLSGRQMAKLFRPKPSLCGQSITVTIDNTYFCCHAVLLESTFSATTTHSNTESSAVASTTNRGSSNEEKEREDTSSSVPTVDSVGTTAQESQAKDNTTTATKEQQESQQQIVLFSIIVALVPTSAIKSSASSSSQYVNPTKLQQQQHKSGTCSYTNPIVPAIRRVHVSLSRLCRILEREERRCQYVSCQTRLYEAIRSELTSTSSSLPIKSAKPIITTRSIVDKAALLLQKEEAVADNGGVSGVPSTKTTFATPNNNVTASSLSASSSPLTVTENSQAGSSNTSMTTNNDNNTTTKVNTTSHRRTGSFSFSSSLDSVSAAPATTYHTSTSESTTSNSVLSFHSNLQQSSRPVAVLSSYDMIQQEQELEQSILETIMTSPPTRYTNETGSIEIMHTGNLAQELAQVYHAFARRVTDKNNTATASRSIQDPVLSSTTIHDGVVYMNRHIAVLIEAVASNSINKVRAQTTQHESYIPASFSQQTTETNHVSANTNSAPYLIRPYMTLLFPHMTPNRLLKSLNNQHVSSNQPMAPPRRIQQLLQVLNPKKSLSEMANESFLPLQITLELATQLVRQGYCIVSPVLSYSVCLVCSNNVPQRIQDLALPFYQQFGFVQLHLLVFVRYLTEPNRTMGMSISQLVHTSGDDHINDPILTLVRKSIVNSMLSQTPGSSIDDDNDSVLQPSDSSNAQDMEEIVYEMIVWLCYHQLIVPVQEYIICIHPNPISISFPFVSQETTAVCNTTTHSNDNTRKATTRSVIEERKYDDTMNKVSSTLPSGATTLESNSSTTKDSSKGEWMYQGLCKCLLDHQQSMTLLECGYQTGIDLRTIRTLVHQNDTYLRILSRC